jgi:hypothetical protein
MVRNDGISSTEKKRIRDRRAQQKHRERRGLYTKQLEDQVAFCQRNHEPAKIRLLVEKVGQLQAINETLLRERERLLDLVNNFQESLTQLFSGASVYNPTSTSTAAETDATAGHRQIPIPQEQLGRPTGCNDGHVGAVQPGDVANTGISSSIGTEALATNGRQPLSPYPSNSPSPTNLSRGHPQIQTVSEDFSLTSPIDGFSQRALSTGSIPPTTTPVGNAAGGTGQVATELAAPRTLTSSPSPGMRLSTSGRSDEDAGSSVPVAHVNWLLLPANTNKPCKYGCSWLDYPHAVADAPDTPQPEDLLFGSRKNLLANGIHKALRTGRVAEPERLAMGWIAYIYSRWRVIPTRENFARMPHFLRPTPEQIRLPHQARIDMVPWPSLRLALIKQPADSQLDEMIELLACCLKLRWPWGKEFLQMRDDGSRQLVDEFLNTLMSLDGWGITREFAVAYPHLVEDLNPHIIEFNVGSMLPR